MNIDFQTRRLGPRSEDCLDLFGRLPLPAKPAIVPSPFGQRDPLPLRTFPSGLDPLRGGLPRRRLLPAHLSPIDPCPKLVERFESPSVQMEFPPVGLASHQQDVNVDMIRVAMNRHQGRVVFKVGLVQELPGHGQRFFRGDAFFK